MYLTAETVTLDDDEGRFTIVIDDDEGRQHSFLIHHVDLDAFYNQVKGRLGPYLNERDRARVAFLCDPDESGGYDISDPKSEGYHDRMSAIHDNREKV